MGRKKKVRITKFESPIALFKPQPQETVWLESLAICSPKLKMSAMLLMESMMQALEENPFNHSVYVWFGEEHWRNSI